MSPIPKKSATFHSNFAYTRVKLARELKKLQEEQLHEHKQVKLLILVCPMSN